jgi:hypothetical protein
VDDVPLSVLVVHHPMTAERMLAGGCIHGESPVSLLVVTPFVIGCWVQGRLDPSLAGSTWRVQPKLGWHF